MSNQVDIQHIVATHAKGFGEVKLARLKDGEIDAITKHMLPGCIFETRAEKLDAILAAKRRQARATKRTTKKMLESVVEFKSWISRFCWRSSLARSPPTIIKAKQAARMPPRW